MSDDKEQWLQRMQENDAYLASANIVTKIDHATLLSEACSDDASIDVNCIEMATHTTSAKTGTIEDKQEMVINDLQVTAIAI